MILLPLYLYQYYGDTSVLEQYYPIMVQYMRISRFPAERHGLPHN